MVYSQDTVLYDKDIVLFNKDIVLRGRDDCEKIYIDIRLNIFYLKEKDLVWPNFPWGDNTHTLTHTHIHSFTHAHFHKTRILVL